MTKTTSIVQSGNNIRTSPPKRAVLDLKLEGKYLRWELRYPYLVGTLIETKESPECAKIVRHTENQWQVEILGARLCGIRSTKDGGPLCEWAWGKQTVRVTVRAPKRS